MGATTEDGAREREVRPRREESKREGRQRSQPVAATEPSKQQHGCVPAGRGAALRTAAAALSQFLIILEAVR